MLYLYRRVIFGALTKDSLKRIRDLSPREIAVFAPLVVLVFWMGLYPAPFLEVMHVSVSNLLERVETARASMETAVVLGR
jgi:NADH-quinone oxidoreductase subunit M